MVEYFTSTGGGRQIFKLPLFFSPQQMGGDNLIIIDLILELFYIISVSNFLLLLIVFVKENKRICQ